MKSATLKTAVLVFGIALFISNISYGQSQKGPERRKPPTFKQLLKEMDANEDGKLSKKEIKAIIIQLKKITLKVLFKK